MPVLRLENVSKYFAKTRALLDINLEVKEGTFLVVLGPSGCGKSTLLNVIAGLEEPTAGRIFLDGSDITAISPHKRNIAMIFQNYALYPHLSVFENIAFGLRIRRESEEAIKTKVEMVAGILGIQDKLTSFPRQLSGGQKQRVATGRAIVREPALFLFDEPLSNLDARLRIELRGEFIKLHQRLKKTIVYVTHDQLEAMSLGEQIVVLNEGIIQQVSGARQLYDDPNNLFIAKFMGIVPMNILQVTISRGDQGLELIDDKLKLALIINISKSLDCYVGKTVYLGFRPSAIQLSENGILSGEVIFIENIGEESYVRIKMGAKAEVNAKMNSSALPQPQETVRFNLDLNKLYFFDSQGERIR